MTDDTQAKLKDAASQETSPNGHQGNGEMPAENSWMERMGSQDTTEPIVTTEPQARLDETRFEYAEQMNESPGSHHHPEDPEIERLRDEARRMARSDADSGVPALNVEGLAESELELTNRCVAMFDRWQSRERRTLSRRMGEREEQIAETLAKAEMGIDRFHRVTNELIRLKARFAMRKREVTDELSQEGGERNRGIPTRIYIGALVFLGLVEFFANAPVFGSLLPRDPLTETQIRLLTETATGWFAGVERVGAHIIFRPDAALLAAGVITFLCVLAHFFGHSLRDLVMQGERKERRHTVHSRSVKENVVPIALAVVGLVLTLGVLYEARLQLGEVGQERYVNDMAQVEELRRQSGWLRVDGEILQANQLTNQADDLESAATELREYSVSMARMNFPILLLNLTLVLCAISAAYFHQRDAIREHFNETPFEDERAAFVERGEELAQQTSQYLSDVVKDVRMLKTLSVHGLTDEARSLVHQLESVVGTYRAENSRARGVDSQSVVAFRVPVRLPVDVGPGEATILRDPDDYEEERSKLAGRFREMRAQFNQEATATW